MPISPADSTLTAIQTKVRRLTRSPSVNQLSDGDLNQYINTFVTYDFPEHLRLFNLRTTFTFYTQPYVDAYPTNLNPISDEEIIYPLQNFDNLYLTVHPPVYIAGYQALYLESRDQLFGIYPKLNLINSIGTTGNGVTTRFTGVINTQQQATTIAGLQQTTTLLQNQVLFSSIDSNFNGLGLVDYPLYPTYQQPSMGALGLPGQPPSNLLDSPYGSINYVTGEYVIDFPTAPGAGQNINFQVVPVQPTLPQTMCYFDSHIILRPVPDQVYRVQMEVYQRPTELLATNQSPQLEEWWQYIAYGAAKKILEDRMDMDTVQLIMPEFKKQEMLVQRRTIVQYTSQRAATIYTEDNGAAGAYGPGWWSGGGTF
jgi:hypothetical protein